MKLKKETIWTPFQPYVPCKDGCIDHWACYLWACGWRVGLRKFWFIKWLEFTRELPVNMWHCREHNTFGEKGWNCAICGYPSGFKNFEFDEKTGVLKRLVFTTDLLLFKFAIYETINLVKIK